MRPHPSSAATSFLVLGFALASQACAPTCSATCRRFYAPPPEGCDAPPESLTAEEAQAQCVAVCNTAMQIPGPAPSPTDRRFDPESIYLAGEVPTLANEKEAAAWIDCVWSFDDDVCHDKLDRQYCAKIY
ncbi:MAG: hypothetical protein RLZZ383_1991 [Pseudomonadota bacterium]|jgi:hypothetical protein